MALLAVWDDSRRKGACQSCKAKVTFFQFAGSGRYSPFDGEPTYVKTEQREGRLVGFIDSSIDLSHFATCPDADQYRRPR